jgi:hypothetical protein
MSFPGELQQVNRKRGREGWNGTILSRRNARNQNFRLSEKQAHCVRNERAALDLSVADRLSASSIDDDQTAATASIRDTQALHRIMAAPAAGLGALPRLVANLTPGKPLMAATRRLSTEKRAATLGLPRAELAVYRGRGFVKSTPDQPNTCA